MGTIRRVTLSIPYMEHNLLNRLEIKITLATVPILLSINRSLLMPIFVFRSFSFSRLHVKNENPILNIEPNSFNFTWFNTRLPTKMKVSLIINALNLQTSYINFDIYVKTSDLSTLPHLVLSWVELPAWQFEECCPELEEQHVGEAVLVNQQNPVHAPPHPVLVVLIPHPLEPSRDAGVLLKQRVLRAECVVGQRVEIHRSAQRQRWVLWETRLSGDRSLGCSCSWPSCSSHSDLI